MEKVIQDIIQRRRQEIEYFNFLVTNYSDNLEYNRVMFYKAIPFRNGAIKYEVDLLEKYYGVKFYTLMQLIEFIYGEPNTNFDKMRYFLAKNGIEIDSFGKDWKLGHFKPFFDCAQNVYNCFAYMYDKENSDLRNNAIGNCAEYIVYELLTKQQDHEIIFVSRDIGDGFGYDIIDRDIRNDKFDIIEVKGIGNGELERNLTPKEEERFKIVESRQPREKYHVYFVYFKGIKDNIIQFDLINNYYKGDTLEHTSFFQEKYTSVTPLEEEKYKSIKLFKGLL